jgi:hypothetical protein
VVRLWHWRAALGWSVVVMIVLAAGIPLLLFSNVPKPVFAAVVLGLSALISWSIIWHPRRKYAGWSYRLRDHVLELRHGRLWRWVVSIPCSRLQHVDVREGPLERRLHLTTLVVHTAGTKAPTHEIPGLDRETALRFRRRLLREAELESGGTEDAGDLSWPAMTPPPADTP